MLSSLRKCLQQAAAPAAEFGCCLLYGQETYPVAFLLSSLKQLLKEQEEVTVEQYDYSRISLVEELSAWDAGSLFAAKKIIVLSHLDGVKKDDVELLTEWLARRQGDPSVFLFLTAGERLDGRSLLVRSARKYGTVIKTDGFKPEDLRRLIVQYGSTYGVTFSPSVLDILIHYHDARVQLILREVEKLALFVGPGGVVNDGDLELMGCGTVAGNIFALVDELGAGRTATSLRVLNRLLRDKTVPLVIVSMVVRHYRLLALAGAPANRGKSVSELARDLRVPPFVVQKLRRQTSHFPLPRLVQSFQLLAEIDRRLKSSSVPELIVMENMVLSLCRRNANDS
ncbi:MAG: DNA polymerase III subunit delta [Deltaproteobacteria bacterium]|nr:DNA polymerase III subunit delta [Candidatus Anaeroferrophillus wilburensis]MBN2890107.1 DNA polymerase III subunit delta [Deltaproteobacteria bacterium]